MTKTRDDYYNPGNDVQSWPMSLKEVQERNAMMEKKRLWPTPEVSEATLIRMEDLERHLKWLEERKAIAERHLAECLVLKGKETERADEMEQLAKEPWGQIAAAVRAKEGAESRLEQARAALRQIAQIAKLVDPEEVSELATIAYDATRSP